MEVVVDERESFNEVLLDAVVYVGEVSAVVLGFYLILDIGHVRYAGNRLRCLCSRIREAKEVGEDEVVVSSAYEGLALLSGHFRAAALSLELLYGLESVVADCDGVVGAGPYMRGGVLLDTALDIFPCESLVVGGSVVGVSAEVVAHAVFIGRGIVDDVVGGELAYGSMVAVGVGVDQQLGDLRRCGYGHAVVGRVVEEVVAASEGHEDSCQGYIF